MKEDSLLFNELLFRETFKWLADNPDKDYDDCPLTIFYSETRSYETLPVLCQPALQLCRIDEEQTKFKFPEARSIIERKKKKLKGKKWIMAVPYCIYCPIDWPVRWWTHGIMVKRVKFPNGFPIAGIREKHHYPCDNKKFFGKGILYKWRIEKNLEEKSRLAKKIAELPLTEIGKRLVSGKYNDYKEVLLSYV